MSSKDIFQGTKAPTQYKEPRVLVEDCIKISVSDFPKKLLYAIDNNNGVLICKKGSFIIDKCAYTNKRLYVGYEVNLNIEPAKIKLYFTRDLKKAPISQTLKIKQQKITYGLRWYFLDANGRACNTLYLPPGELLLGSREEYGLAYELTKLKKHIGNGLLYNHNRLLNANNKLLGFKRTLFRHGCITKRTWRIIRRYGKYNFEPPNIVRAILSQMINNMESGKYEQYYNSDKELTTA